MSDCAIELANLRQELAAVREQLRWRDVKKELPEYRTRVLTIGGANEHVSFGFLDEEGSWGKPPSYFVTHWLPIPPLPEQPQ